MQVFLFLQNMQEKIRLDKYLWSIRIFKTRAQAAEACDKGRVRLNGIAVKASRPVHPDEEYTIRSDQKNWIIKVTGSLSHRVPYAEAIKYYVDLTPPEEKEQPEFQSASFHTGKRLSKIGRPTKKQRRDLEDFIE